MATNWEIIPRSKGGADFDNLLAVLGRRVPKRPTLFEFFLNEPLYQRVVPELVCEPTDVFGIFKRRIIASARLGYDYCTVRIPGLNFKEGHVVRRKERSVSLNEGSVIHNRSEFDAFQWPDPETADYDLLARLAEELPPGMKLIPFSADGVLENVISLVGFENLCMIIYDDRALAFDIFEQVGERLARYYERVVRYDCVGACISNDDWGFKTQTMLSPADLRHFVFPWHKRIAEVVHAAGKPVILHSCGYFAKIIDDVVDSIKIDGRHSFEDTIMPVEEAYEAYHDRIAILGGIDMDYICRSSPEAVFARSRAMLERTAARGGYALGTGNSVPEYVPDRNYFAMIRAILDARELI